MILLLAFFVAKRTVDAGIPHRPPGKGVRHPYRHIRGRKSKTGRHTLLALIRRNGTRLFSCRTFSGLCEELLCIGEPSFMRPPTTGCCSVTIFSSSSNLRNWRSTELIAVAFRHGTIYFGEPWVQLDASIFSGCNQGILYFT